MEEIVAHPDVDHGGLRRDGFHGGMRIDAGGYGEKSGIGDAEDADAAVVVGNVFEEPGDGVVGVGAFVDERWDRSDRLSGRLMTKVPSDL